MLRFVVVLGVAGALVACGGGGGSSSSGSSTATATKSGATDPAARERLPQAVPALADFGPGWKQYQAAGGFAKLDPKNCAVQVGSPLTERDETYSGPMLTDDAQTGFVYGSAVVFTDAATAKRYTKSRRSKAFTDCKEAQDDAAERTRNPGNYVRVVATTNAGAGQNGLEAYYREDVGTKAADGTETPGGNYARYTYRHGPVVYVIDLDAGSQSSDAASQALAQRMGDALDATVTKINQRLDASGSSS